MLPDPQTHWEPWPSIIDGVKRPPFVYDRGVCRGRLSLIVIEARPVLRAYGVQMDVETYCGVDEAAYSIVGYGASGASYDGGVYIKEARGSVLLERYAAALDWLERPRHFLFVGGDYCYEVLGGEPVIRAFANEDAAWAWRPEDDPEGLAR